MHTAPCFQIILIVNRSREVSITIKESSVIDMFAQTSFIYLAKDYLIERERERRKGEENRTFFDRFEINFLARKATLQFTILRTYKFSAFLIKFTSNQVNRKMNKKKRVSYIYSFDIKKK